MEKSNIPALVIGQINGHDIVAVVSRASCFADVPEHMQAGCMHIICNPAEGMSRAEAHAKGITAGKILDMACDEAGLVKKEILAHFFPGQNHADFDARKEANGPHTATMDTVHVHLETARIEYWKQDPRIFRRCVDSLLAK